MTESERLQEAQKNLVDKDVPESKGEFACMNNLKTRELKEEEYERLFDRATANHLAVKVRELFVGTCLPCSVLFPTFNRAEKKIVLQQLLPEEKTYDRSLHDWLLKEGIDEVYIPKDKEDQFFEYLSENVKKFVRSPEVPSEKKTLLLYDSAESIVSKVFRERPSRANLSLGGELIENLAVHLTLDAVTSDALLHVFSKDYYTFTHSVQVAVLGMAFCNYLQWPREEVIDYGIGALFHDVGKSHIDDEILNKPSRLTKDEFEVIKKHTVIGYQQLKNAQIMSKRQLNIPLSHHEAMDGTGYPQGLKAEAISKYARVARIIDCYDALTTKRPYKEALPSSKALDIMSNEMGATFDSRLLHAFIAFLGSEKKMQEASLAKRLNLELGNEVFVMSVIDDLELKLTVLGMETDEILILRVPNGINLQEYLSPGEEITARYVHSGAVYRFTSKVLGHVSHPLPFVMLSYPKQIESMDMRKEQRNDCLLRVRVKIGEASYYGLILNQSSGGCKVVLKLMDGDKLPNLRVGEKITIYPQRAEEENSQPPLAGEVKNLYITDGKAFLGVQFQRM